MKLLSATTKKIILLCYVLVALPAKTEHFGPTTEAIVAEATKRNIPHIQLNNSIVQLGYGKNQTRIQGSMTAKTTSIAADLSCDKEESKAMLAQAEIPVPAGIVVSSEQALSHAIKSIGFPLVVKPLNGNKGRGVTIAIRSEEQAKQAFFKAHAISKEVIVEPYATGNDFRALVINNKFVAAALREPAQVTGDGFSTIQQLIDQENKNPLRGDSDENFLTKIIIDEDTINQLTQQGYTPETVLPARQRCTLKGTANLSTGGTAIDVTDNVHPDNIALIERAVRVIGLDICGVDIIAPNLREPLKKTGGVIIEVNASPGLRMHLNPTKGTPRNVAVPIIDMLFPAGTPSRIPLIAVTGTNGKTTTTRFIAHVAQKSGFTVGYTTSDGIYINESRLVKGDTTGPESARFVLKDPSVDFAVLETPRGGILRAGIAFDASDVAVFTNVQPDHLGLNGIDTLDQMARVKAQVLKTVKKDGYAVINADDKRCVAIARELPCKIAYFSTNSKNPIILNHIKKGGIAAVCERGAIVIKQGKRSLVLEKINQIPLTHRGTSTAMIYNTLAGCLASYVYGFDSAHIKASLKSFVPSPQQTPGRMNLFQFKNFKVILDYTHNSDGYIHAKKFMDAQKASYKIGVIGVAGDRRDQDIKEIGALAARTFDHIIIRQDQLRGRTAEGVKQLLVEGIRSVDPEKKYEYIAQEEAALDAALKRAKPGAIIFASIDAIDESIQFIEKKLLTAS